MENIVNFKDVEKALLEIRGQSVILDSDVARLYGVNTMRVNEAVKNNPDKFPTGYIIELTKDEKNEVIENFDNPKLKFSPVLPKAFTEKGLYMLATILKSPKATQTTIAIIETFAKIKELTRTVSKISESHDEQEQKGLIQHGGDILSDLLYQEIPVSGTETSVELNFAVLKLRHTIKREK
ncbi:MAG TPA: ORF6N domain-containing protein [Candidatus Coprenecus pullicola]|nr:ORF6N domain-containing protein [Candidatus Coprenecus pullicola]